MNYRQRISVLFLLSVIVILLAACAGAAEEPAAPVEEPEEPEEPVEPSEQYPVQYGQDSRTELFQHSDTRLKEMAGSVAVFVHSIQLNISGNSVTLKGYTLDELSEMGSLVKGVRAPMCSDEMFISQPAPGFCTGFLVSGDTIVTAGHCLKKTPCADMSIVFGFQMESADSLLNLTRDNIFKCAEVVVQETPSRENQFLDYAIIKLDRRTGRAGLDFASEDSLETHSSVAVLGHPSGLPMKIAADAYVTENEADNPYFVTNLDTFGSNSGSPVINTTTYQVEGILVSGDIDYVPSNDGTCIEVKRCPEGGTDCTGENVAKISKIASKLPDNVTVLPTGFNCYPVLFVTIIPLIMMKIKNVRGK